MYKNIYYSPEAFGLEVVGEIDWAEPDYSFDMLVVWKERRGRYWIGEDAGCSCPAPFEDISDINSLDGPYTKEDLRKRINFRIEEQTKSEGENRYYYGYPKAELKSRASEILSRI